MIEIFVVKTTTDRTPWNQCVLLGWMMKGKCQPPKNSVVMSAAESVMATYSPNMYRPKPIDEYSVWYPPTSSASHSAMSKGSRLFSASAQVNSMTKPSNPEGSNQRLPPPKMFQPCSACFMTMSCGLTLSAIITTMRMVSPS